MRLPRALRFLAPMLLFSLLAPGSARAQEVSDFFADDSCPARPRFWASGEYLLWWIKDAQAAPPLVTSAPGNSTTFFAGALGQSDTTLVFGGKSTQFPLFSGGRFLLGAWLDDQVTVGIEANYFFLGNQRVTRSVGDNGNILTNPIFDVFNFGFPPADIANYLAFPALGTVGTATFSNASRLQGAECNGLVNVWEGGSARIHLLGGFRYLNLRESLTLATTQNESLGFPFPGQFVNTQDDFITQNHYYAGQIGTRFEIERGAFFFNATGKVAFGTMREVVNIRGVSTTNSGPPFLTTQIPVTTVPGGIYTQPSNIGKFERDQFAFVPEATVQAGFQWGILRAFVGYNFLFISDVARPGNQISRSINTSTLVAFTGVPTGPLVGPAQPTHEFRDSNFWAQGISFGFELNY